MSHQFMVVKIRPKIISHHLLFCVTERHVRDIIQDPESDSDCEDQRIRDQGGSETMEDHLVSGRADNCNSSKYTTFAQIHVPENKRRQMKIALFCLFSYS